jgi:CPA1 family monovalent cation:H+ antiporter
VAFLLESGIFLLMGLQLKTLLDQDADARLSAAQALWIGLAAAAVAVVLRRGLKSCRAGSPIRN